MAAVLHVAESGGRCGPRTMKRVYNKGGITLYQGDYREIFEMPRGRFVVDHVITDPPYNTKTHDGARAGNRRTEKESNRPLAIEFAPVDASELRVMLSLFAGQGRVRRWFVATMAYQHIVSLEAKPPDGWQFMRFGVWVKPDAAPQFSGDRPGMGWEGVAILHREGKARWNNGGYPGVWRYNIDKTGTHPTGKPQAMLEEMVRQFTDPGETILDPFAGSGTTLLAAKAMGRKAIGIEIDPHWCDVTIARLEEGRVAPAYDGTIHKKGCRYPTQECICKNRSKTA